MATRKRREKAPKMDELIKIINDYMEATGAEEIEMNEVAKWAMREGRWAPPPYNPQKACARALSGAA